MDKELAKQVINEQLEQLVKNAERITGSLKSVDINAFSSIGLHLEEENDSSYVIHDSDGKRDSDTTITIS